VLPDFSNPIAQFIVVRDGSREADEANARWGEDQALLGERRADVELEIIDKDLSLGIRRVVDSQSWRVLRRDPIR